LRDAGVHGFLLEDFVEDEFCDKFDVADNFLFGFFEEVIFVLV
jgi:hypothetical protein